MRRESLDDGFVLSAILETFEEAFEAIEGAGYARAIADAGREIEHFALAASQSPRLAPPSRETPR